MAKYKITINNPRNLELLLQQIFDEADSIITQTQNEINKISNSVNLADEDSGIDAKTKYSKAINDLINTKQKAVSMKLDLGKLMTEIIKYNGNANQALNESSPAALNFDSLKKRLKEELDSSKKPKSYTINN